MNPKPGEIYLVDFGMIGKVRPAIVMSREDPQSPRALSLCAPITTASRASLYEVPLGKLKFLERESWANAQGLTSIGHEKLVRRLGWISGDQISELKQALRYALDL